LSDSLPPGWRRACVGDLARPNEQPVLTGPFGTNMGRDDFVAEGCPVLTIGCLTDAGIRLDKAMFVREEKASELDRYRLRTGDLLFSRMASVGRGGLVPPSLDGALFNYHIMRLRLSDALMLPELFLAYVRGAPAVRKYLEDVNHGATRDGINTSQLLEMPVLVPPLNEQRRIVAKLEALQARSRRACAALDAVPRLLEKLRQSILATAFRGDLTKDWRAKNKGVEPASELLKRIRVERRKKWEEGELAKMKTKGKVPGDDRWKAKYKEPETVDATGLPHLPEGWCWASVDDISELQLGQQRAPIHTAAEKTHPYVRAANITWDGLDLSDIKRMGFPDPARYRLKPGDVLLNEASGSPSEVGKPAIWRGEIPDCCYQKTLLRVRPISCSVPSEWIHLAFLADARLGRFARMAPGVGILHLTADRMLSWPIALSPTLEQKEILRLAGDALAKLKELTMTLGRVSSNLTSVDRAILTTAFRGELVGQDSNGKAAAAMLACEQDTMHLGHSERSGYG
jgi:type I restriction enzyme, S subunit